MGGSYSATCLNAKVNRARHYLTPAGTKRFLLELLNSPCKSQQTLGLDLQTGTWADGGST